MSSASACTQFHCAVDVSHAGPPAPPPELEPEPMDGDVDTGFDFEPGLSTAEEALVEPTPLPLVEDASAAAAAVHTFEFDDFAAGTICPPLASA